MINDQQLITPAHPWQLVQANFSLTSPDAASIAKRLSREAGTYMWTVSLSQTSGGVYCLYIGKCSNLAKRIYAYTQSFQPHSPNDRKIAFAQTALRDQFAEATFNLYFKPCEKSDINAMETAAIAEFSPFLNQRSSDSVQDKNELETRYKQLYRKRLSASQSGQPVGQTAERKSKPMHRYLISFDDGAMEHIPAADLQSVGESARAVVKDAKAAGAWIFGSGVLHQQSSIVATDGAISDGPVPDARANAKAVIGGFSIIEVSCREEALVWAARFAQACQCAQEVREIGFDSES